MIQVFTSMARTRVAPSWMSVFFKDLIGVMNMIIAPPLVCHKLDGIFLISLPHVIFSDYCAVSAKAKWVTSRQHEICLESCLRL